MVPASQRGSRKSRPLLLPDPSALRKKVRLVPLCSPRSGSLVPIVASTRILGLATSARAYFGAWDEPQSLPGRALPAFSQSGPPRAHHTPCHLSAPLQPARRTAHPSGHGLPSSRGHWASGELGSSRPGLLGLWGPLRLGETGSAGPEERAGLPLRPARHTWTLRGPGEAGPSLSLASRGTPEQKGSGRVSRPTDSAEGGTPARPGRDRRVSSRARHGASRSRLRAAAGPGRGGSVAGRSLGLHLRLLCQESHQVREDRGPTRPGSEQRAGGCSLPRCGVCSFHPFPGPLLWNWVSGAATTRRDRDLRATAVGGQKK